MIKTIENFPSLTRIDFKYLSIHFLKKKKLLYTAWLGWFEQAETQAVVTSDKFQIALPVATELNNEESCSPECETWTLGT